MILAHIRAHSISPIYFTISVTSNLQEFLGAKEGDRINVPFGEWYIRISVEEIRYRDGCKNIISSKRDRAWILHTNPHKPIQDFWIQTADGQMLILPKISVKN